ALSRRLALTAGQGVVGRPGKVGGEPVQPASRTAASASHVDAIVRVAARPAATRSAYVVAAPCSTRPARARAAAAVGTVPPRSYAGAAATGVAPAAATIDVSVERRCRWVSYAERAART